MKEMKASSEQITDLTKEEPDHPSTRADPLIYLQTMELQTNFEVGLKGLKAGFVLKGPDRSALLIFVTVLSVCLVGLTVGGLCRMAEAPGWTTCSAGALAMLSAAGMIVFLSRRRGS